MTNRKNYAPVQVKNPTSMQHMVWLEPGQTLVLHLKLEDYPAVKVDTMGGYLTLLASEEEDGIGKYLFIQDEKVAGWAAYSSCFLGDIWIDSDTTVAKMVVMLNCETTEKKDFVTVVNPDCTDLRLKAHNVLEVILCDHRFKDQDEWVWEWHPLNDVGIEQVGYDYVQLDMWGRYFGYNSDEPSHHPYARLPRSESEDNRLVRQHHYWFRFSESIINVMTDSKAVKHLGNLKFYGWADRFNKNEGYAHESILSLMVDLSSKYRSLVWHTLLSLKKHGEVQTYIPRIEHYSSPLKRRHVQVVPRLPTIREVAVKLLDSKSIEDGCKTMELVPQIVQAAFARDDVYDDHSCRHRFPHFAGCGPHDYYMADEYKGIYDWWD